jgi:hypothetical protein
MKYIKVILLFFSFVGFSQTIEIYNYDKNGIREITPTKIIETNKEQINIYNVDKYGIKEIAPTQIIKDNKLYETKDGILEFLPRQTWITNSVPVNVEPIILPTLNLSVLFIDF